METRVLRYFLAVAREENISRAAEVLHITQPTLSRQLSQMEEELGVILFERGTRRIRLTDAGVLLRRRAEEIIGLIDKTEKELAEQEALIDGHFDLPVICRRMEQKWFGRDSGISLRCRESPNYGRKTRLSDDS